MKWAILSTWKMSYSGASEAAEMLKNHSSAADAAVHCIQNVEDNPEFMSVGFGGLPDETGHVVLDGGFMDGDTLRFGAVGSIEGFRSPVAIARSLKDTPFNNFLVGTGAEEYAKAGGFEERDNRTPACMERFRTEKEKKQDLMSYDGHDTVCALALDETGSMCAGVSTSGLFLKKKGRVGDSPVVGCGYYADSAVGAAAATGVGEEIMKGVLSFRAVMYMKNGMTPMEAAHSAVSELKQELEKRNGICRPISLIVLGRDGSFGVSTTIEFPFVYAGENEEPALYLAMPGLDGTASIKRIDDHASVTQD